MKMPPIVHDLNLSGAIPQVGLYIGKHCITRIWACSAWNAAIVQLDGKDIGIVHNCHGENTVRGNFRVCIMRFAPDQDVEYQRVLMFRIHNKRRHFLGFLPVHFSEVKRMKRWRKLYMAKDYDGVYYIVIVI